MPNTMHGKYKIGQHLDKAIRKELAKKILERNSPTATETLRIMGFEISGREPKMIDDPLW
jgi:hypothetical protein